jgi:hypothetical protein
MATEPVGTSAHYDPYLPYTAPVGRLPILGKARAEIDAVRAKSVNDTVRAANEAAKILAETTKITADIANDAARLALDTTRQTSEIEKIGAEIIALTAQTANEIQKTLNDTNRITAEVTKIEAEIIAITDQNADNHLKILGEIAYTEGKTTNETQQTVNDTTRATNDTDRKIGELAALNRKSVAETYLLDQKTVTELAQTNDAAGVGGVVKAQKDLFAKQTDGFDRDAEQKLAKIMIDTWMVRASTGEAASTTAAGLAENDILGVMNVAKTGVGAPTSTGT